MIGNSTTVDPSLDILNHVLCSSVHAPTRCAGRFDQARVVNMKCIPELPGLPMLAHSVNTYLLRPHISRLYSYATLFV